MDSPLSYALGTGCVPSAYQRACLLSPWCFPFLAHRRCSGSPLLSKLRPNPIQSMLRFGFEYGSHPQKYLGIININAQGSQVLVHVSIFQGSILFWVPILEPHINPYVHDAFPPNSTSAPERQEGSR